MELFAIIGILTAYFRYRNARTDGKLQKEQNEPVANINFEAKPLPTDATRMQRFARWLGLEGE